MIRAGRGRKAFGWQRESGSGPRARGEQPTRSRSRRRNGKIPIGWVRARQKGRVGVGGGGGPSRVDGGQQGDGVGRPLGRGTPGWGGAAAAPLPFPGPGPTHYFASERPDCPQDARGPQCAGEADVLLGGRVSFHLGEVSISTGHSAMQRESPVPFTDEEIQKKEDVSNSAC